MNVVNQPTFRRKSIAIYWF